MSYLPFARKYRPQTFEELIGQPHVTTTLTRAFKSKRIAQAYLFAGQRGVGKTSAARILAKCLNCERGPTAQPCNTCASCTQITQGRSLDVIEIDGASNRGIDEIRNLRETMPFAPATGSFRVYIIDEVHMLTTEAFNALLKTLEEPPAHVKFVFATTAVSKVPATVLSRCQRFDFRRLEAATIVEALTQVAKAERLTIDEPARYAIARAADGSLRDAEVVLEQLASFVEGRIGEADVTELLGAVETDALFAWTQAILERDPTQALHHLRRQLDQGRDPAQLLTSLLQHVRNLLVIRSIRPDGAADEALSRLIDEPAERITRLKEQAGRTTAPELLVFLQILTGAYELIRRGPLAQTVLELVIVKLATREQWQSLEEISRRLEQLHTESPLPAGAAPPAARPAAVNPGHAPSSAAPSPAPQPAALSTGAATVSLEQCVAIWPTLLERLATQKISLAAYLADSRPIQFEGRLVTIGLPGSALHQEVLADVDNHRFIDRLLSEVCQATLTVQYATLPTAEAVPGGADEPRPDATHEHAPGIVQDIVKLFNATVIDKPRPTS